MRIFRSPFNTIPELAILLHNKVEVSKDPYYYTVVWIFFYGANNVKRIR
nr:MAG TPA: hypothetical protein [Bacteriophage sp.]